MTCLIVVCFGLCRRLGAEEAGTILPPAVRTGEPLFLDMDTCLRTAMSNNMEMSLFRDGVSLSQSRQKIAVAGLFPALSVRVEETHGKEDAAAQTPGFVERVYGLQANQPVFSGGRRWAANRQAHLKTEIDTLKMEILHNTLRHQVTETFWKIVALENARRTYEDILALLQDNLEKAARHELGDFPAVRIEMLSARAQTKECEFAKAETEQDLAEARERLLELMGYRTVVPFEIPLVIDSKSVAVDEAECLRLARQFRQETVLAEKEAQSALWQERVGQSGLYPRVDLNGFYGRSGAAYDNEPFQYQPDWNAGVKVSWALLGNTANYAAQKEKTSPKPGESLRTEIQTQSVSLSVGDALQTGWEAKEARHNRRKAEWQADQTRLTVEQDVRASCRKVNTSWKHVESADARLDEALQNFKDTRALLQDEKAHLGDRAAAQNRIAAAKTARFQAHAQYRIAVSNLNRAVGVAGHFSAEGGTP